ncbi:hypothetical protein [Candidatus Halobonum tyrrellensis]|uniref:Uncharacterized protein n=1 Tax=Candidatus Halobonum tyrrellensis G22 TaxID=1324957 RepID=V4HDH1_9EURY|nr:hypothetical protein [Candidatus Halobonum tyrrellensis]ESP88765.1 hypothetical protein K933_07211 [Candidatus Halobonum tyrrellensis G22]
MSQSPSSLRETLSGPTGVGVVVLFVLLVAYSFFVAGSVLFPVWVGFVAFSLWLFYRFVVAHERIAAANERRATAGERRARAAESRAGVGHPDAGEPGERPDDTAADPGDADDDSADDPGRGAR